MNILKVYSKQQILSFAIPAVLIAVLILTTKSSPFINNPSLLSISITLDLLLIIPLVHFLLIRKTAISKNTVFLAVIIGLFICYKIIPADHQTVLPFFRTWLLPVAEIGIIGYIIVNLKKARRNYRLNKGANLDFYTTVQRIASDILPSFIARMMATEVATLYYGILHWRKRPLQEGEFSSHKKSSSVSIFLGIMLIIGVETTVFHYILVQEGNPRAWLVTFISIYSILQMTGFLKSLIKRPIFFDVDKLHLRYGIMKETTINLSNISSIVLSSKAAKEKSIRLSLFGTLESHNVTIYLKKTETLYGIYGIKKKYKVISFYVDESQQFFDSTCTAIDAL